MRHAAYDGPSDFIGWRRSIPSAERHRRPVLPHLPPTSLRSAVASHPTSKDIPNEYLCSPRRRARGVGAFPHARQAFGDPRGRPTDPPHLERGQRIDAGMLRAAMEAPSAAPTPRAPGTGNPPTRPARPRPSCSCARSRRRCARGRRRPPPASDARQGSRRLLPTHTRRSAESQALQQFSTPIALGLAPRPPPR